MPWEDLSVAVLAAGGEIEQFALDSKEINISPNTFHQDAVLTEICFQTHIYEKDCLISDWGLCRKECPQEDIAFNGEVSVTEVKRITAEGTGSAASASAAAPLKLTIKCEPYERNWMPVIFISIIIVVVIAAFLIINQVRKPVTRAKKMKKYQKLQARLRRMKKKLKK